MTKIIKILIGMMVIFFIVTIILNIKINSIDIIGNEKVSDVQIATHIFESPYDNISIVLFLKDRFLEKKKIPLVSKYEIEWQTPFSIIINVTENPIIGFVRRDIRNVYFDKDGSICEVSSERKDGIIEVVGISFRNTEVYDKIELNNEKLLNAVLNISSFCKENNLPVDLLEIRQDDTINVYLGNIEVNLGDIDNMEIKLMRLNDIYPKIDKFSGTLDLKDARDNMLDEQYIFKRKK